MDEPDGWNCTLRLRNLSSSWGLVAAPASASVDVTPRRLQRFVPVVGEMLAYVVSRATDTTVITSGFVQVDSLGLATVPQAPVVTGGVLVCLYRSSALGVGAPLTPRAVLAARALRNPARGRLDLALSATPGRPLDVSLMDALGRAVRPFPRMIPTSASFDAHWDVAGLAPGLYFAVARQSEQHAVARVILLP